MATGHEYLLPVVPRGVTRVPRSASKSCVRRSPARSRGNARLLGSPTKLPAPQQNSEEVLPFPSPDDRLEQAGSDLLEDARSGIVRFPGGELRVSLTPAMTPIDVDGHLPPAKLAMAGAEAATDDPSSRNCRIDRHRPSDHIGKAERQAIGAAVDAILPQPFERTAVNGFGFLQIVRARARVPVRARSGSCRVRGSRTPAPCRA